MNTIDMAERLRIFLFDDMSSKSFAVRKATHACLRQCLVSGAACGCASERAGLRKNTVQSSSRYNQQRC